MYENLTIEKVPDKRPATHTYKQIHAIKSTYAYAQIDVEGATHVLGMMEDESPMPEMVTRLVEAGREVEALRLWREMQGKTPPRGIKTRKAFKKEPEPVKPEKKEAIIKRVERLSMLVDLACTKFQVPRMDVVGEARKEASDMRIVICKVAREAWGCTFPECAYILRGNSRRHSGLVDMQVRWNFYKDNAIHAFWDSDRRTYRNFSVQELYEATKTLVDVVNQRHEQAAPPAV